MEKSVVFADCTAGLFDGFRVDLDGRVWTNTADGVHCYDPDGTLIGKVLIQNWIQTFASAVPSETNFLSAEPHRSMRFFWLSTVRNFQS